MSCDACGRRFEVRRRPSAGRHSAGATAGLLWVALALLALWILLQLPSYADRARVYDALASALDAFRHPAWAAVVAVSAVVLLTLRRLRTTDVREIAERPADILVREEEKGRLTVMVAGDASALDRDFVFDRRPAEEALLLKRLSELATRSASFARLASSSGEPSADGDRDIQREIYAIGLSLAELLLGDDEELRDLIYDLPADNLLLRMQPSLSHLPWELLVPRPGAEYLWQRFHVGRQLRGAGAASPAAGPSGGPLRMLLLADLESDTPGRALPAAAKEAVELLELAALMPEKLRVVRRTPRAGEELGIAFAEGFDVVHFAGHTIDADGRHGWVLADGAAADPSSLLPRGDAGPALVFTNACGPGRRAILSEWATATPAELLGSGVTSCICTTWELPDLPAADMSRVFYRNLLAGKTLGQALTAARNSHIGVSSFAWANYVLYGDPTGRLSG
ncbi:MAG: CHAT domain-containing protein [Candidatus Eisenbacteria bacterium]|nr:CHAT domain-containing protein [Candidatus Eisenbacteria bacterium]